VLAKDKSKHAAGQAATIAVFGGKARKENADARRCVWNMTARQR
jgi:hypothetical protein